jgi:hypothetical protein
MDRRRTKLDHTQRLENAKWKAIERSQHLIELHRKKLSTYAQNAEPQSQPLRAILLQTSNQLQRGRSKIQDYENSSIHRGPVAHVVGLPPAVAVRAQRRHPLKETNAAEAARVQQVQEEKRKKALEDKERLYKEVATARWKTAVEGKNMDKVRLASINSWDAIY